ncbi:MAG: hypothetical protein HYS13_05235 [Planctomycetia bacterium]|nr:hypothetical protein [Planctomycetia bacterium]
MSEAAGHAQEPSPVEAAPETAPQMEPAAPEKGRSRLGLVLVGSAALVLVAGGAFGAYWFFIRPGATKVGGTTAGPRHRPTGSAAQAEPKITPGAPVQVRGAIPEAAGAPTGDPLAGLAGSAGLTSLGPSLDDPAMDRFVTASRAAAATEVPVSRRWEFVLPEGITVGEYADYLDELGMELAVLMDDGKIEYVAKLAQAMPTRRQGTTAAETRPYLTWQRGDLIEADRQILAKAGLEAAQRIVLHFWPQGAQDKLAQLEKAFQNRSADQIFRTRFGVRRAGAAEFYVVEQIAR